MIIAIRLVEVRFVDRRSGKAVSSIDSRAMNFVIVKIDTRDVSGQPAN